MADREWNVTPNVAARGYPGPESGQGFRLT